MINYLTGDATNPQGNGNKLIPHIVNDKGGWGAGFVLALSRKWTQPEKEYRKWFRFGHGDGNPKFELGNVQFVSVEKDIIVANMIAQTLGYTIEECVDPVTYMTANISVPPIRYDALKKCLEKVNSMAISMNATIHAPRFGSQLAGGSWSEIEKIINEIITVDVYIYDLPKF